MSVFEEFGEGGADLEIMYWYAMASSMYGVTVGAKAS